MLGATNVTVFHSPSVIPDPMILLGTGVRHVTYMAVADTFQALMSPSESQTQASKATCLPSFSFKLAFAFLFSVSFSTFLPHPGFWVGAGGMG